MEDQGDGWIYHYCAVPTELTYTNFQATEAAAALYPNILFYVEAFARQAVEAL